MQEIARWNSERDCWETSEVDLLSGLPVVFSETWPASVTMRNNILYQRPMSAHHMDDSGSLFSQLGGKILPTPVAQPSGNTPEDHLRKKPGRGIVTDLAIIVENGLIASGGKLLPTPRSNEANGVGAHGDGGQDLRTTISELLPTPRATRGGSATETTRLLPTPNTMEHLPARTGEARERQLRRGEGPEASRRQSMGNLREDIVEIPTGEWGPYDTAIQRWEQILGRSAPEPTEEGPKGGKRLSAMFVEWLMGLPEGWVTAPALGLSRVQQLKMLGNGVVTQQAIRALRMRRADVRKEHE